jgi:hypothetical protein
MSHGSDVVGRHIARNWMEGSTKVLEITQRTSKQALRPLNGRLSEAV